MKHECPTLLLLFAIHYQKLEVLDVFLYIAVPQTISYYPVNVFCRDILCLCCSYLATIFFHAANLQLFLNPPNLFAVWCVFADKFGGFV